MWADLSFEGEAMFLAPISVSLVSALLSPSMASKLHDGRSFFSSPAAGQFAMEPWPAHPQQPTNLSVCAVGAFVSACRIFLSSAAVFRLPIPVSRLSACIARANEGVECG